MHLSIQQTFSASTNFSDLIKQISTTCCTAKTHLNYKKKRNIQRTETIKYSISCLTYTINKQNKNYRNVKFIETRSHLELLRDKTAPSKKTRRYQEFFFLLINKHEKARARRETTTQSEDNIQICFCRSARKEKKKKEKMCHLDPTEYY